MWSQKEAKSEQLGYVSRRCTGVCEYPFASPRSMLRYVIKKTHRDAQGDITKLFSYLIDNKASKEDLLRISILTFDDPKTKGLERLAKGWIEEYLSGSVNLKRMNLLK